MGIGISNEPTVSLISPCTEGQGEFQVERKCQDLQLSTHINARVRGTLHTRHLLERKKKIRGPWEMMVFKECFEDYYR